MFEKNKWLTNIMVILFLIIYCFVYTAGISAAGDLETEIQEFVRDIYADFAGRKFKPVYDKFAPGIKSELTEEEYIKFQQDTLQKYEFTIEDYKVNGVKELQEIPEEFIPYIRNRREGRVFSVDLDYCMSFKQGSGRASREISKEVYIYRTVDKLFLLWNPEVVD